MSCRRFDIKVISTVSITRWLRLSKPLEYQTELLDSAQDKLNRSLFKISLGFIFLFLTNLSFSQKFLETEGPQPQKVSNYNDSTFQGFYKLRFKVAQAQINLLKNGGALLVRLKTNANAINKLKASGNMDLATQIERETYLNNKNIVRAYKKEFTFCPVYFFYSTYSDSVKHKSLSGILLDTNLVADPNIVCQASFYLIAEQGSIRNSSLGFVPESQANKAIERGSEIRSVFAVIKNRYFIQVHEPFPYYQKGTGEKLKNYVDYVKKFNQQLMDFYTKNVGYDVTREVQDFVY